jgi:hypothetical protein
MSLWPRPARVRNLPDALGAPPTSTCLARRLGVLAAPLVLAVAPLVPAVALSSCNESPTSPSSTSNGANTASTPGSAANGAQPASGTSSGSSSGSSSPSTPTGIPAAFSLRFHGNGENDLDRVKIPIDPQVAGDVGTDFTVEFWMKAESGANASSSCQAGSDGWTYGNILIDRDVSGDGDHGEYGVSLSGGRIAFGVARGERGQTICGLIDVADGRWHHVAVTRRSADGQMRIYVDGTESGQGFGPAGDISYRDGRPTSASQDPFLVLGSAKHELGVGSRAFSGWIDELRISGRVRYTVPFDRPTAPFTSDAETVLLYHFDEGPAGPCASTVIDRSGRSTHGQCRHGGSGTPGPKYVTETPFNRQPPTRQARPWPLGKEGDPSATVAPLDPNAPVVNPIPPPKDQRDQ